jgi:hypothetical protein
MIKKFSLDDVEIEAIIDGLGEVVVLLAGLGGEASVFEEFTP